MAVLAYQITRYGVGFDGRKRRLLGVVLTRLSLHLKRIHGPFTINDSKATYDTSKEVVSEIRNRFKDHPNIEFRYIVRGSRYDESAWSVRSIAKLDAPDTAWVAWARQYVGRSSYLLDAPGPPGPSDCSGLTMNAVKATEGIQLAHSADLQSKDGRITHFHDAGELQNGDFVFLNYGRLAWPQADHVEFWIKPGQTLGSRPSTGGVNYYSFTAYDFTRVITFGRLKT